MYQLSIIYGDNDVNVTWNNNINSGILQTCLIRGVPLGVLCRPEFLVDPLTLRRGWLLISPRIIAPKMARGHDCQANSPCQYYRNVTRIGYRRI